jgi:energy-coupling factor transporter transmembrane protein EcfT
LLISFGILFSLITNPIEFPTGFMQIGIPHKFGVTLMVGYRMMPLLSNKINTVIDAQKARGADFKFRLNKISDFFTRIFSLIIPIIHSTLETSVRLSDTLISRGYDPDGKITKPRTVFSIPDFLIIGISILILVISLV